MKKALLIGLILLPFIACAQVDEHEHEIHDEHEHNHHYHVGIAMGPVYVIGENEFAPGLHLHMVRLIDLSKGELGLGVGLEGIFDEHRHYAASFNISYLPIHNLTFTVAPGVQYGENNYAFTTHFECSYEFIFDRIHIGPVIEYAWATTDAHFMAGVHIGFGF
ncbi:MAG: hypothetical protein HQ500_02775 [Flavobacteriales bacterium]|nr:hypothetical protein [Flavobacteriales bacterium]